MRKTAEALALVCLAAACVRDRPKSHTVETLRVLRETVPTESRELVSIVGAIMVDDSTLAVIPHDRKRFALVRWSDGALRNVGRAGGGPGEFRTVMSIVRANGGTLVTLDPTQQRLSYWRADGGWVKDQTIPFVAVTTLWTTHFGITFKVGDTRSRELRFYAIADTSDAPILFRAAPMSRNPNAADTSCGYCAASMDGDGAFALGVQDTSYRILRFDSEGAQSATAVRVGIPLVRLQGAALDSSRAKWTAAVQELENIPQFNRIPSFKKSFREFAARQVFHHRFIPDGVHLSDGVLVAQRNVSIGDSAEVDVFDSSGRYRSTVRLPPTSRVLQVKGNRWLAVRDTIDGFSVLSEYRLLDGR